MEYILKLEVMNSFIDLFVVEEEVEEIIEVVEEVVFNPNPIVTA